MRVNTEQLNMRHHMQNFVAIGETVVDIWRFFDFQDGDRRHLGFFQFQIFNCRAAQEADLRRYIKFGWNRSKRSWEIAIFLFFQMAAAAILDFSNFKFLTVGRLKRAELRCHAKFGRNRSKHGRDYAIFRFFKMAAATILDFSNFARISPLRVCINCSFFTYTGIFAVLLPDLSRLSCHSIQQMFLRTSFWVQKCRSCTCTVKIWLKLP